MSKVPGLLALAATALLLAGCTTPTPYQPSTDRTGGYTDERIGQNRYRVTFTGNSVTPRETVEDYLLLRSAEVALQAGYQWFVFDTRDTHANTSYHTDFTDFPGFGPHFGFGWYWHNWDFAEADTMPVTRYEAYAEIVLLAPRDARDEPRALNANEVIANIGPRAILPKAQEPPPGPPPSAPPPPPAPRH